MDEIIQEFGEAIAKAIVGYFANQIAEKLKKNKPVRDSESTDDQNDGDSPSSFFVPFAFFGNKYTCKKATC